MIRKGVFKNGRISLGTEMENELLYVRQNARRKQHYYTITGRWNSNRDLPMSITLGHSMIATFKGGITNYMNARGVIKGQTSDDYEFRTHPDATGYFSVGISFHPFEK
jgi:hypothetical protein